MAEQTSTSPDSIEAEIAQTSVRLAGIIDELAFRAQPREIVRRETESVKARFHDATHTPEGELRRERVAAMAAAVSAVVLALVMHHRHHHQRRG
jgi:hypothetical protein